MMLTDDPILLIPTTSEQRARTIAHEMGHALGLAHPDNNCPYPSIMFQSTQTNATFEVTNADKYNIRHLFWE
jgi:predicted Zn-dependent protease